MTDCANIPQVVMNNTEELLSEWRIADGLKGYPGFTFTRVVPVSDKDFINLRSDLLIYRKLLKTEFF